MKSKSIEEIGHLTSSTVKAISNILAPSCVGCPSAKSFVSVDRSFESDKTKVKITVRCDKMTLSGPACPDGGTPGQTYLKDLGISRTLGDQQVARAFELSHFIMEGMGGVGDVERVLKSPGYTDNIKEVFQGQADEIGSVLHELTDTINFVTSSVILDSPIIWRNETKFDTLSQAMPGYVSEHINPYLENMDHPSGICEPTPYMEEYFPKELRTPFGIFTERPLRAKRGSPVQVAKDIHGNVMFLGDDPPPQPITYEPEPTQDEIYEDWGTFA